MRSALPLAFAICSFLFTALNEAPAFGQEPTSNPDVAGEGGALVPSPVLSLPVTVTEAPDWKVEILLVPAGSLVLLPPPVPGAPPTFYRMPGKYFLLPEDFYDTALVKAKQLDICQPALDRCTTTTLDWQKRVYDALGTCSDQFGSDEKLVADLTTQVRTQETRALVAEDKLKMARKNQAVAWAITGGLVLGAATVTVLTLAN